MDYKNITILLPCQDQKKEFLIDAINSVLKQTSPDWILFVIIDPATPEKLKRMIDSYTKDPRIKILVSEGKPLAGKLNTGMKHAGTEFICILFSDDLLDKKAIEVLQHYIKKYPDVDFFHSSRRYIDAKGKIRTKIMRSKQRFSIDYFKKRGSPIKLLLCWRREKGIEVGGIDEELDFLGCDDYDFPWTMLEAGCKFKAIKECLYYYRVHHDFYRITTHVTIAQQVQPLRKQFKKHGVSEEETNGFIKRALKGYLIRDRQLNYGKEKADILAISHFREITQDKIDEFFCKGYKKRHFFSHRIYYLPKSGPDGLKMAQGMCGIDEPNKLWEVVLYACSPDIDTFPKELFFDNDLIWHQQQFGRAGQIATANLVVRGPDMYGNNYLSDIVQRIAKRREYKTRIENWFVGWHHLLLNSIMNFALENKIKRFYSPTADFVIANTDPKRRDAIQRELFERVYDRAILEHFRAKKKDNLWVIDVAKNRDRIVIPEKKEEIIEHGKTICICHDIERGLGHLDVDPEFAKLADKTSLSALSEMLVIERQMGIKATYNVLGCLFNEVRESIEKDGYCIAFHSYNHKSGEEQLLECRQVDYRIKGYRPPRSQITAELSDKNLCYHNFEWLASSANSLKTKFPKMQNRIVKIPILFDDFDMHKKKMKYEDWEQVGIDMIKQNYFVAFCLHDCYADYWLPYYKSFLEKIRGLGNFKTLDQVSSEIILSSAK